ncbi:hypothetical protein Sp245p_35145 (plasmid) [Azospirillum baldaniorum]|uniref:Uncharacterized protein n=1 Tax=Azospirillum baldaniorum TaxID=1064539 RepID=A0A9P1K0X2_9PROT|nr:hypothetical protein Sp245p_35145 [Azospirillum baldaniorum]CCD03493.1 protein of unknown function [Azospirillum baldaniorum]
MGGSGVARGVAPVMPRTSEYINISVPNARTLCVPPTILSARRAIQEGRFDGAGQRRRES